MKKRIFPLMAYLLVVLLACNGDSSDTTDRSTRSGDFTSEAENAGYDVPNVSEQGVSNLSISDSSTDVIDTDLNNSGSTTDGVVDTEVVLDDNIPGTISIYIWINGNIYVIDNDATAGDTIICNIVLSNGYNYICVVIYVNGTQWGRSSVVRIQSTVAAALARFELTWNGYGDVDLHLDNEGLGIHVYFGDYYYSSGGYEIELDVDNVVSYGPENIRVYSVPSSTTFRCFVNYYSGSSSLTATVKVYDSNNNLFDTKTISLSPSDVNYSWSYDSYSKLVGNYTVSSK